MRIGAALAAVLFLGWTGTAAATVEDAQARAVKALEQLAKNGSPRAAYELGRRYETGVGVAADLAKAFDLYCEAAESGYAQGAYGVARLYLSGQGIGANKRAAAAWAAKAAALGHPYARELLADMPQVKSIGDPGCKRLPTYAGAPLVVAPPREIAAMVRKMAPEYGLDAELVLAVIQAESGFRTDAVSPRNAHGLMQLIPDTAERFGVRNLHDARDNIRGGMRYLRWLLSYFEGEVALALAAYNAGEGAVLRYGGIPPFRETQDYVARILSIYPKQRHPYDRTAAPKAQRAAQPAALAATD
ncbi:transglycosylase SLT domain-containing protein [Arenibaculum pallidiluteum]|uniref:transglycosylase SLT domain-containing protein n=1 Tax=Arenibaculum pallidiluteum TaxID=2812559 RepID=UPI001A962B17|nr:transglycosylase SLT domain-containing protein [Arenibaculum pallidiluteum]